MNPSAPERRGETVEMDRPAAPALPHYPQSTVRYPLLALTESGSRPARSSQRPPTELGRLRRMKRNVRPLLWWLLIWYVVVQLSLFVWIDKGWQFNRTRVEHEKWEQLHERVAETPDRPLVLMLGSSRTDWAFQAGRLSGQPGPDGRPLLAYNLGVPTTGPIHAALYLNDLLDEGIRPRLLLVEYVTTHLNQSRRGLVSEEHFTLPRWLSAHELLFLRSYFTNPRRAIGEWVESRMAPWYGFSYFVHQHIQGRDKLVRPFEQTEQPMDDWGCRILCDDPGTSEYRSLRWAGAYRMYGRSLQQFHLGAGPAKAMHDLLTRCRRENIPVALVLMPVTNEFRQLFSAEGRAELDSFLAELRERYGAHLIDASDWLDKKYFDDGHHVLKAGADKFSTRMIDEVQKILARTEPSAQHQPAP